MLLPLSSPCRAVVALVSFNKASRSRGVDCFSLQLAIIQNHLNGRDSHVRQMRVYTSRGQAAFDIESGARMVSFFFSPRPLSAALLLALAHVIQVFSCTGLQLARDSHDSCVLR